jgi:selenocysteine lyase/cysteine desulfurase
VERPLTVYTSKHAHSSVEKAALLAGFGRDNVRLVPYDEHYALRPDALASLVDEDLANGRLPCAVVATTGTTATTAVDPIEAMAALARRHALWLHVDAAMAGSAMLLPECRWMWRGIEGADSVVVNPHKWLGAAFDCSVYYVRDPEHLVRVMSTNPSYLQSGADGRVKNYRDWGIPLGRRFRALKLWFLIREQGVSGLQARLRRDLAHAQWLATAVAATPQWRVCAPVALQTVCVRHEPGGLGADALNRHTLAWADRLNRSGRAYVTPALLEERWMVRVSIGAELTERRHVHELWDTMREAAAAAARCLECLMVSGDSSSDNNGMPPSSTSRLITCVAVLFVLSSSAFAQSSPPQVTLPTVTVTAQKEPADQQSLPVSVTAIPADWLDMARMTWISEAALFSPNTVITEFTARKLSNPRIRGVGASPGNAAVGTYVDGVPVFNSNASSMEFTGVEQIEFVRGPQSALFGRNTLAGVINVLSERPSLSGWTGEVVAPFGNFGARDVRGGLSGPLSSRVALAVSAGRAERDGFTVNTVTGNDLDSRSATFGKAQLLLAPSSRWETRIIASGEDADDGDYALNDLDAVRANPFEAARDYEGYTRGASSTPRFSTAMRARACRSRARPASYAGTPTTRPISTTHRCRWRRAATSKRPSSSRRKYESPRRRAGRRRSRPLPR